MRASIIAAILLGFAVAPSHAQQRCPAGESSCSIYNAAERMRDRVNQGRRDVNEAEGPFDKAKEVGKTLRDCAQCGMDAVTDGAKAVR